MDPFGSSWNNPNLCIPSGAQVWYTDGSKLENGDTGAGVYGPRFRRSIAMGKTPSIFQAEIHAIEVCAIECIRRRMQGATIFILSDSQAALKALESFKITSKLVDNCLRKLDCLGERNTLTVGWIPGHEGHEGNEIADCLAKKGAIKPLIGPEPFCGLARGHTMEVIRNWEEKKLSMYWIDSDGQRQAKRFLIPARNQSKRMVGLRKSDLRILTGYLTGHCSLRYHLKKLNLSETETCRFCALEQETSEHVLCECPALCRRRLQILGGETTPPYKIWGNKPNKVLNFIKSLNL
ncbi:hypothetical protein ACLKA7_001367 [Drosophila subpalustris]